MKTTTKNKRFYYKFWLESSGQSSHRAVRMYQGKPSDNELKDDVEDWAQTFGCWRIADHLSYGWEPITRLPKNRKECIKRHTAACKEYQAAKEKKTILAELLGLEPYR